MSSLYNQEEQDAVETLNHGFARSSETTKGRTMKMPAAGRRRRATTGALKHRSAGPVKKRKQTDSPTSDSVSSDPASEEAAEVLASLAFTLSPSGEASYKKKAKKDKKKKTKNDLKIQSKHKSLKDAPKVPSLEGLKRKDAIALAHGDEARKVTSPSQVPPQLDPLNADLAAQLRRWEQLFPVKQEPTEQRVSSSLPLQLEPLDQLVQLIQGGAVDPATQAILDALLKQQGLVNNNNNNKPAEEPKQQYPGENPASRETGEQQLLALLQQLHAPPPPPSPLAPASQEQQLLMLLKQLHPGMPAPALPQPTYQQQESQLEQRLQQQLLELIVKQQQQQQQQPVATDPSPSLEAILQQLQRPTPPTDPLQALWQQLQSVPAAAQAPTQLQLLEVREQEILQQLQHPSLQGQLQDLLRIVPQPTAAAPAPAADAVLQGLLRFLL